MTLRPNLGDLVWIQSPARVPLHPGYVLVHDMPNNEPRLFRGERIISVLLVIPALLIALPIILGYTIKILATQWKVLVQIIRHVAEDQDN